MKSSVNLIPFSSPGVKTNGTFIFALRLQKISRNSTIDFFRDELNKFELKFIHKMKEKSERKKVDLQRTLSVWGGIALTVGTMIGSGIFISPKSVLR